MIVAQDGKGRDGEAGLVRTVAVLDGVRRLLEAEERLACAPVGGVAEGLTEFRTALRDLRAVWEEWVVAEV